MNIDKRKIRKSTASILICFIVAESLVNSAYTAYASDLRMLSIQSKLKEQTGNILNKAGNAVDAAKNSANSAKENLSVNTSEAAKNAKEKASEAGKNVKNAAGAAKDKASEGASKAASAAGNIASDASKAAKNTTDAVGKGISGFVSTINKQKFEKGWRLAVSLAGSKYAANIGTTYVNDVSDKILTLQKDITNAVQSSNRLTKQEAGFTAETWMTDTFNAKATAAGTKESAYRPGVNYPASEDISTTWGEKYSLKYYDNASQSAQQQAKTYIEKYKEYYDKQKRDGKQAVSQEEFLDKYTNYEDIQSLYDSLYKGQKRIIPEDQLDDAVEYLKKRKNKFSVSEENERKKLTAAQQDTLDNLADRLTSPKGVQSEPLTKSQAETITDLARRGDFDPADFNVKPSQLITKRYILKQAMGAGVSAATFSTALAIAPDIYSILRKAIVDGKIDENELKKTGIDGAIAGSSGFVEGYVSDALLVACKTGKLGASMQNVSPDTIGTLTVLVIDSARYGYKLANGDITSAEYANQMTEECFVAICSQASGATAAALLPMIPFAYIAGSMAGSMIATAGYEKGEEIVMSVQDAGGFETVIPETAAKGMDIGAKALKKVSMNNVSTNLKQCIVSITKAETIKIKHFNKKN